MNILLVGVRKKKDPSQVQKQAAALTDQHACRNINGSASRVSSKARPETNNIVCVMTLTKSMDGTLKTLMVEKCTED
jgi:hypothetical protein